jgi:diguanylate cyclase (GGDEF)-like protein
LRVKRKAAKPNAKPRGRRTPPAPSGRARNGKAGGAALKQSKPRSRATAVRLVSEVDRLAAELQASRAHIRDLESRIDVDPLTETLNRRGFERALTRSLAYIKRYGANATVIYLDLDDFKPVNDRHGHAAGDAVLKAIAAKLAVEVRASDVVARIGGDEFVVLLWNMTDADATAKAAELERAVIRPRCAGAPRRWSSVPPPVWRSSARSTRRPTYWRARMPPCMRARRSGGSVIPQAA